ncbi:MAG TPA: hypothetical protein DGT23_16975 [Micromonosporaceae bacterium]|nr:hypothetical protein [Micromonosporaceae bacterium]
MDDSKRAELDRRTMDSLGDEKVWRIDAYEGCGPVTMNLQLPTVTITDSEARFIVISPRQASLVSSRLESINDWLQYGEEDDRAEK